jgi:nitrilase
MSESDTLKVALAQIAPVWLDRAATTAKMLDYVKQAAQQECDLIAFGEALLPGYPFWLAYTGGARFNDKVQKEIFSHYHQQAVQIEAGHLQSFCHSAKDHGIAILLGIIERPKRRGGHSLYCSMVYIDPQGTIRNVHRKLMPTYEERLCWSPGDGHGLRTFSLRAFHLSGLNCWENWMPLPRAALYAQGSDLHFALWPGNARNTEISTRFIAREARAYTLSVSGLMRKADIPEGMPHYQQIYDQAPEIMANGGSCIAQPDGEWLVEPLIEAEQLIVATLDHARVREERQNFDPSGHYSRPDVTQLTINHERQRIIKERES